MRFRTFRGILDECLESVRRGESVDSCLERYPKHADRLRPLLTLSSRIQRAPSAQARPWAQATAWDVVRQRAAELRSGKRRHGAGSTNYGAGMWLRPLAVATALMLAIVFGGGATALASQSALPDSPLYRVKLFSEDVHLWFVFDDSHEAGILLDQSDQRMDEMLTMARKGRPIPSNVLSAMESRHERAADIVANLDTSDSERQELLGRLLEQSASQEDALLSLWDDVSPGGRDDYTAVVAALHNTRLQGSTELVLSADDLSSGIQQISGELRLKNGVWVIAGDYEVIIDERTIGGREIASGATATGVFGRAGDGTLRALSLTLTGSAPAFVYGEIEEVSDDGVRIAGQWIPFDARTIIYKDLKEGDRVHIEVGQSETGTVASSVSGVQPTNNTEDDSLTFVGTIESDVSGADQVVVSGVRFAIPGSAKIDASTGTAKEGARALVEASYPNGVLTADSITVLSGKADPDTIFMAGTYAGQSSGRWIVSGIAVTPPEGAEEPEVGTGLSVEAQRVGKEMTANGYVVIERPGEDPPVAVTSTIQNLNGNHWDIAGLDEVRVNNDAVVIGDPDVGDRILFWGHESNVGVLQATYVRVLE